MKTAVWLLNMGGPDGTEAVQPFLYNLLNDHDLIPFPIPWLQWVFAAIISRRRAAIVAGDYERMGGVSPQLAIVREQCALLQAELGEAFVCRPVFRYWGEGAMQAAAALEPGQPVVLLSLYPHACGATTRSSLNDARRALRGHTGDVRVVESYPDHPGYVAAMIEGVSEGLAKAPDAHLVFSAHGMPQKRIDDGDPYLDEIERTVAAVLAGLDRQVRHTLCFQSKVGVTRWLEPSTLDTMERLGSAGEAALVVVPIAFTSDHIETLVELDIENREVASRAGVETFVRVPALNSSPTYVTALADLTRGALAQERPA